MQQWNTHNSVGANDAAASDENAQWTATNRQAARQAESYAPCGCSPERVNYLVGLLIDGAENGALNSTELQDVRAELATCELCYQRLEQEERFRAMLNRCCNAVEENAETAAPRSLRERIIVSIRTERTTTVRMSQRTIGDGSDAPS